MTAIMTNNAGGGKMDRHRVMEQNHARGMEGRGEGRREEGGGKFKEFERR